MGTSLRMRLCVPGRYREELRSDGARCCSTLTFASLALGFSLFVSPSSAERSFTDPCSKDGQQRT